MLGRIHRRNTGRCLPSAGGCGWEIRTCPTGDGGAGACFTSASELDPSLKKCTVAADCAVLDFQINCCGSHQATGVAKVDLASATTCASARASAFPACGCPAFATKADDGTTTTGSAATVTCNPSGLCETTFDTACAGVTLPACPKECTAFPMTGSCTTGDKCRMAGSKIGDECSCGAGTWACAPHPPLGPGCNLVCR